MTTDSAQTQAAQGGTAPDPVIRITPARRRADLSTILGIVLAFALVAGGIAMGQSDASFIDIPSILIVIFGTMAATAIAYTGEELSHLPGIVGNSMIHRIRKPDVLAMQLMNIATIARKKGVLSLAAAEAELRKEPFLARGLQLVADGYSADDIERVLGQEVDSIAERHRHSASIMRRAAEIAPAMGLIGTLIGLVQMLSNLSDPSSIGPPMALALLTTFYGALLSNILLSPLAGKLERNSNDETMIKNMIVMAAVSVARQENPRRLEILLNSELPPDKRIRYFN